MMSEDIPCQQREDGDRGRGKEREESRCQREQETGEKSKPFQWETQDFSAASRSDPFGHL
jgi:hypothetical protein